MTRKRPGVHAIITRLTAGLALTVLTAGLRLAALTVFTAAALAAALFVPAPLFAEQGTAAGQSSALQDSTAQKSAPAVPVPPAVTTSQAAAAAATPPAAPNNAAGTPATAESGDPVRISLVTILPGMALYSSFGHTAVRIVDRRTGSDIMYNYGLSAKPFDLRFAAGMFAGRMDFMVAPGRTSRAVTFYSQEENRTIIEQVLDLDDEQKRSLISSLRHDALPENRVYNYRYFTDNCTTRVAVALEKLSGDSRENDPVDPSMTLRAVLGKVLAVRPWLRFVLNTLIGPAGDVPPEMGYPLFLPDQLFNWAAGAENVNRGGGHPFVRETVVLYESTREDKPGPFTPLAAALVILAAALALSVLPGRGHGIRRAAHVDDSRRAARVTGGRRAAGIQGVGTRGWRAAAGVFDSFLFAAASIVAAAILLFWFCAGYPEAAWNLNLLWAGPVPLIALIWAAAAGKRAGKQTGQPGKSGRGSGAYTGSPNIVAGKTGKSGGVSGGNTGPANIVEGTAKNSLTAPRLLFTVCAVCAGLVAAAGGFGVQSIDPAARILALAVAVRCADRGGLLGIRLFRKVAPGKGAQV